MKEISIYLYELTKLEASKLPRNKQYLIYNTFTKTYRVERICPGCLALCKYASEHLKFFIFDREDLDDINLKEGD